MKKDGDNKGGTSGPAVMRVRNKQGGVQYKDSAGRWASPPPLDDASNGDSMMAVLSNILGRSRLARKAGLQFGGNRDIYTVAGYVQEGMVAFDHYWSLYKRDSLAGRIVDMPAKTTWRTPPAVIEEEKPKGTDFTEAFEALAKQVRLWHYLERTDRLAGIGRYAVLLIGASGEDKLRTELTKLGGPEDVIYLAPYSEGNAEIGEWEKDPSSPRFLLPKTYKIRLSGADVVGVKQSPGTRTEVVHWSRVIHVAENLLEDETFGRPRLERALNRLFDLDKVAASTGEAYWQSVVRILQATIDKDVQFSDEVTQLADLDEKLGEMIHDLRRQFTGRGVELGWLDTQTPNVSQVAEFYFSLLAGAAETPKRILFGSELGELASTTDQATYFGRINERQEQFAEPAMLRAFINRMIELEVLPPPDTGEYKVIWPVLFEEPEKEKAEANLRRAQAASALVGVGGDPLSIVEIDEDRMVWLVPRAAGEPRTEEEELLPGPDEEEPDEPEPPEGAEEGEGEEEGEEEGAEEEE